MSKPNKSNLIRSTLNWLQKNTYHTKLRYQRLSPREKLGAVIVLSSFVLFATSFFLLITNQKKTFSSNDQIISIQLPKNFYDKSAQKKELVPVLLPELVPNNVNLLVATQNNQEVIYSYEAATESIKDLETYKTIIKKNLEASLGPQNVLVETITTQKKNRHIRFTANNHAGQKKHVESCLFFTRKNNLLTVCSRVTGDSSFKKAQELLANVKIKD